MKPQTVLFVCNGLGEESGAFALYRALREKWDAPYAAAPLQSAGKAFQEERVNLWTHGQPSASGGSPFRSARSFWLDVSSGAFREVYRYLKALYTHKSEVQCVIGVGDFALSVLTRLALPGVPMVLVDGPKSSYIAPHFAIEKAWYRRTLRLWFVRDMYTATDLQLRGYEARFDGNIFMSAIAFDPIEGFPSGKQGIGCFPGSREGVPERIRFLLDCAAELGHDRNPYYYFMMPGGVSRDVATPSHWQKTATPYGWRLEYHGMEAHLVWGALGTVLEQTYFCVGAAGTAVEQAAGLGKATITFSEIEGSSYQPSFYSRSYFADQCKLLGDAVRFEDGSVAVVAKAMRAFLENPSERERRGSVGKERMGDANAAQRIAEQIVQHVPVDADPSA